MAVSRNTQSSREVQVRIAEQDTVESVGTGKTWVPFAATAFGAFGGGPTKTRPSFITESRQTKRGQSTGRNTPAEFTTYLNDANIDVALAAALQSLKEVKNEKDVTAIGTNTVTVGSSHGFVVGDLVAIQGSSANLGVIREVTAVASSTVTVSGVLTSESSPSGVTLAKVGAQAPANDIAVSTTGNFARYTSTAFDFTRLGLVEDETFIVGGDGTTGMDEDANNGIKKVQSVSANALVVKFSETAMVTESAVSNVVQFITGDRIRERDDAIAEKCFAVTRTMGKRSDGSGGVFNFPDHQYVLGAFLNTIGITAGTTGFPTSAFGFVGNKFENRKSSNTDPRYDPPSGSGVYPSVRLNDPYNLSTDVLVNIVQAVSATSESPTPLFNSLQSWSMTYSNQYAPTGNQGTLGPYDNIPGEVSATGSATALYNGTDIFNAIDQDTTCNFFHVSGKPTGAGYLTGTAVDVPDVGLGGGSANVTTGSPITVPFDIDAGQAESGHTIMFVLFRAMPTSLRS